MYCTKTIKSIRLTVPLIFSLKGLLFKLICNTLNKGYSYGLLSLFRANFLPPRLHKFKDKKDSKQKQPQKYFLFTTNSVFRKFQIFQHPTPRGLDLFF